MMYRKISLYAVATLLLCAPMGCDEDFLETEPLGSVSDASFWSTEQDARIATNNLYNYLYDVEIFQWDAMSDIVAADISSHGLTEIMYARSEQQSDNPYGDNVWSGSYAGIRAVNDMLLKVEQIENVDPAVLNRYKAEARFIRAYLYTYLTMFFGDVPLVTEPLDIEASRELSRTSQAEVWTFIGNELQAIAEELPVNYESADQGRITRGAALAMKARAMLWAGSFVEARDAAQAVMELGVYDLYPSYEDLFSYQAENNAEVILDKQFIKDTYSTNVFWLVAPFSQNSATTDFYPTAAIVNAYETAEGRMITAPDSNYDPFNPYLNRDPRLGYSVFVEGDLLPDGSVYDPRPGFGGTDDISKGFQTTATGFNIQKYVNPEDLGDPQNNGINIMLIRYADVLLMYAEAKIELSELDATVYEAINQVRQRSDVNLPPIADGLSQEALRQVVRHERMVELAFEGQRFFDIKRWEIAPQVRQGRIEGMTYVDEAGDLQTSFMTDYQLGFEAPKDYLWPIPQKEMELNPNYEQNPGY